MEQRIAQSNKSENSLMNYIIIFVVFGILTVIAIPNVRSMQNRNKINADVREIAEVVMTVTKQYAENNNGSYPKQIDTSFFPQGMPKNPVDGSVNCVINGEPPTLTQFRIGKVYYYKPRGKEFTISAFGYDGYEVITFSP